MAGWGLRGTVRLCEGNRSSASALRQWDGMRALGSCGSILLEGPFAFSYGPHLSDKLSAQHGPKFRPDQACDTHKIKDGNETTLNKITTILATKLSPASSINFESFRTFVFG